MINTSINILLGVDSRDAHAFQKFGSTIEFDDATNFHDPNVPAKVQSIGNVECTCYACEYVAQTLTKKEYDIDELFSRVPHDGSGANPRDVLGEVVKNGLLVKGTKNYDKPYSSYWRADTGPLDAFDNARSAITLAQAPCVIWSNWYQEWKNMGQNDVMPVGKTKISSHMYAGDGWATINKAVNIGNEPMLVLEWWGGFTTHMPRLTFNAAMSAWGCSAAILSTSNLDEKRVKSIIEQLTDAFKNLILLLTQKRPMVTPIVPMTLVPLLWDTPENVRHSVRVICDEQSLDVEDKNIICACVEQESQFNSQMIGYNHDGHGKLLSTDYGLVQINDFYHIGPGKDFPTSEYVLTHPEEDLLFMIKCFRAGHLNWWVSYSSGAYKKYLP